MIIPKQEHPISFRRKTCKYKNIYSFFFFMYSSTAPSHGKSQCGTEAGYILFHVSLGKIRPYMVICTTLSGEGFRILSPICWKRGSQGREEGVALFFFSPDMNAKKYRKK